MDSDVVGSNPTGPIYSPSRELLSIDDYFRWASRRYSLSTINRDLRILKILQKQKLLDKEQTIVVDFIMNYNAGVGTRHIMLCCYLRWLRYAGIKPEIATLQALKDLERLRPRKLARIPKLETVKAVISAMREGQSKNFWILIMETGLRFGEAYNLTWNQVQIQDKVLIIERSEKRSEGSVLPLSELAIQALENQRKITGSGVRVFTVTRRTLVRVLENARRKMSYLPDAELVNAKNIRHVFATRLYALTKDLVYVQRMLRHRSILTTQRYVHMVISRKDYDVRVVPIHDKETISMLLSEGYDYVTQTKDVIYLRRLKD